jgi:hypothetical protein
MFERATRTASETLARALDRRTFLKRTGGTLFGGLAALAAGHSLATVAAASGLSASRAGAIPECVPPGPYCNLDGNENEPNGCHGGSCYQHRYQGNVIQCRVFYYYQAGCWTTKVQGGYWTCCDCECGDPVVTSCGCAQFSTNPVPRPDSPGGTTPA